ncbi:MAG: hypothetical protein GY816_17470 [Cytophagales bacterium]|nr:hypothetical protein [Cytophagales bacterium]
MIALCDLHTGLNNCNLVVSVGEATQAPPAGTNGTLTITIPNVNGSVWTTTISVTGLNQQMQTIVVSGTPQTGNIHLVTALLTIPLGIPKSDSEVIQLC